MAGDPSKDRYVVELALGTNAPGVVTTDDPLADGINGHALLRDVMTAWHVEDAAAALPAEERRRRGSRPPTPQSGVVPVDDVDLVPLRVPHVRPVVVRRVLRP